MDSPTETEQQLIVQFRKQLSDLPLEEHIFKDMHLIRWIRARDHNLDKGALMLRKHLDWRLQNDIDNILSWRPPNDLSSHFRFEIFGYDKDTCPIIYVPFGKWDLRTHLSAEGEAHKQDTIRLCFYYFEQVYQYLEERSTGKTLKKFSAIADMEGLGFMQFTSVNVVDGIIQCVRAFEASFPETLNVLFIVNAPAVFSIFWGIVQPFLSAHTLRKIEIIGSDPVKIKTRLSRQMPVSQIPKKLGGTAISTFNFMNVILPSSKTQSEKEYLHEKALC